MNRFTSLRLALITLLLSASIAVAAGLANADALRQLSMPRAERLNPGGDTGIAKMRTRLTDDDVRWWYSQEVTKSDDTTRECEAGVVYRFHEMGRVDIDSCVGGAFQTRSLMWRMKKDSAITELQVGGERYRLLFRGKNGKDTMVWRSRSNPSDERMFWSKGD